MFAVRLRLPLVLLLALSSLASWACTDDFKPTTDKPAPSLGGTTSAGAASASGGPSAGGASAGAGSGAGGATATGGTTADVEPIGGEGGAAPIGGAAQGGAGTEWRPRECSDIYAPDELPTFELKIAADQLALMEEDCAANAKTYRPATFTFRDESVSVMVRLKGNWSWRCQKKQFVISFNEIDAKKRFHGLRKIVLDSAWYEPSLLAERLAFSFMRRVGTSWSCVNNARLMLNGSYYGAYYNVERLDKEYLQRHLEGELADGNLYDGGVELRTNEKVNDVSRRDALMRATDVATIERLSDLEQAVKVWAATAMLPDPDSYWAGVEITYFLYDHPARGFQWLPYDMDLTMRQGSMDPAASKVHLRVLDEFVRADPLTYEQSGWGREPLLARVLSDRKWCQRFIEELELARDAYDIPLMTRELDTWAAQLFEAVDEDPNKLFSTQDHLATYRDAQEVHAAAAGLREPMVDDREL